MAFITLDDWNGEKVLPFKDYMKEDVKGVFLELSEHAETHNVNGTDMPVIIETDSMSSYSGHWEAGAKQVFDNGLYNGDVLLYVSVSDFGKRPVPDGYVRLDGKPYRILNYKEEDGALYIITLKSTRQA